MNALSTPVVPASGSRLLTDAITETRATGPGRAGRASAQRPRADPAGARCLVVITCDHPTRGALGAGERPLAVVDREDLLRCCITALFHPGINGFLGTTEITKDLTLLGTLDGKLVWGSMNRIGFQGTSFEMDDRFGAYDTDGIEASRFDGDKMFTYINDAGPVSAAVLEASVKATDSLSKRGLNVMIESFILRWEDGRIVNNLSEEAVIRSICIAQAPGCSSAHTWLKLLCVSDPASVRRIMASTFLSNLIPGGEISTDPEATRVSQVAALELPNVRRLVVDRSLLHLSNDDVEAAVDVTVALL